MRSLRWSICTICPFLGIVTFFCSKHAEMLSQESDRQLYKDRVVLSSSIIIDPIVKQITNPSSLTVSLDFVNEISIPHFNALSDEIISRTLISNIVFIQKSKSQLSNQTEKELSDMYNTTIEIRPIGPIPFDDYIWVATHTYPFNPFIIGLELSSEHIRRDVITNMVDTHVPQVSGTIPLADTGNDGFLAIQPVIDGGEVVGGIVVVLRYDLLFEDSFSDLKSTYGEIGECIYIHLTLVFGDSSCSDAFEKQYIQLSYSKESPSIQIDVTFEDYEFEEYTSLFIITFFAGLSLIGLIGYVILYADMATEKATMQSEFKSRFISEFSHEIRTPMNGIIGMIELLVENMGGSTSMGYIQTIRSCGFTLLSIINDVLDYSTIESGKMNIIKRDCNFADEIKNTINNTWVTMKSTDTSNKNIELTLSIEDNIPERVCCDIRRIAQVLMNVVTNSLKFTQHGSINISIWSENMSENRCDILFKVIDTGIGIGPEFIKKLFSSFTRLHVNGEMSGTGLGLAISKKLCVLMDGDIWCSSSIGVGTEVSFKVKVGTYSPVVYSQPVKIQYNNTFSPLLRPKNVKCISPEDEISRRRINTSCIPEFLVVDDIKLNRKVLSRLLENMGAHVDTCNDGQEAIDTCKKKKYSVIFMDMVMPNVDGLVATRSIRTEGMNKNSSIVFVTADVSSESYYKCIESGGTDHMTKPVTKTVLRDRIDKYITPSELEFITQTLHMDGVV